jgi:hypothetical protein
MAVTNEYALRDLNGNGENGNENKQKCNHCLKNYLSCDFKRPVCGACLKVKVRCVYGTNMDAVEEDHDKNADTSKKDHGRHWISGTGTIRGPAFRDTDDNIEESKFTLPTNL